MNNIIRDAHFNENALTGDGKGIVEILCIGFEPLLTDREHSMYLEVKKLKQRKSSLEYSIKLLNSYLPYTDSSSYIKWVERNINELKGLLLSCEEVLEEKDLVFKEELRNNIGLTRKLVDSREFEYEDQFRTIAIFESDVCRKLNCLNNEFSDKLITIITYYTEIFDCVIHNGFTYNNKKYVFFTAGAGATRNKKCSFILEEELSKIHNSLYCGLTQEMINEQGGMNTNKYLAYTALGLSNTKLWNDFDIRKAIVVDDIEYVIPKQKVRHIYTQSQEDKEEVDKLKEDIKNITKEIKLINERKKFEGKDERKESNTRIKELGLRKKKNRQTIKDIESKYHTCHIEDMDVEIPFTDGFGVKLNKKKRDPIESFMIRLPFMKGLITTVPYWYFKEWCKKNGKSTIHKITDIYGKTHKIKDVDYIFTKSQFKMYKYFKNIEDENGNIVKTGWEVYQDNFEKYGCSACKTNEEETNMKLNAKTNYQVLQTLTTEMTDDDIIDIMKEDANVLKDLGRNYESMLKLVNATEDKNDKLNWLQKSLIRYPELFKDIHMQSYVKNLKESLIKKLRSGKVNINGAYTFIIPDPIACLQWWLLGERDLTKLGFVHGNNVRCSLFKEGEEVDCLRSPHLDHAHCIRTIIDNDELRIWYPTQGLYVGVEDMMSKFLVYDNDGDKALVHNNKTIIKCAKSFQSKYGMIPNNYTMAKANPEMLNNDNLFKGMLSAYHHGNIGSPSNEITKIFANLDTNSSYEKVMEAIEVVALRCADVNFVIDYAKTLWKPHVTNETRELYKKYGSNKVPYFFIYAKDKKRKQVEPKGNGNIDRISNLIPSKRIHFKELNGKYDFNMLLSDSEVDTKTDKAIEIIDLFNTVKDNMSTKKANSVSSSCEDDKKSRLLKERLDVKRMRDEFVKITGCDIRYIADVIMRSEKYNPDKGYAWNIFGKEYYENICNNIPDNSKFCEVCGERFVYNEKAKTPSKYCNECAEEVKNEQIKLLMRKKREKNNDL